MFPEIVCLCGSTRFSQAYQAANLKFTLDGKIVLTIGCDMRSDVDIFTGMSEREKEQIKKRLDELHLRKIDLADSIFVLNVEGHIGESTAKEIEYAKNVGKRVDYLE